MFRNTSFNQNTQIKQTLEMLKKHTIQPMKNDIKPPIDHESMLRLRLI